MKDEGVYNGEGGSVGHCSIMRLLESACVLLMGFMLRLFFSRLW